MSAFVYDSCFYLSLVIYKGSSEQTCTTSADLVFHSFPFSLSALAAMLSLTVSESGERIFSNSEDPISPSSSNSLFLPRDAFWQRSRIWLSLGWMEGGPALNAMRNSVGSTTNWELSVAIFATKLNGSYIWFKT